MQEEKSSQNVARTNGMAIMGLVCAIISFMVLSQGPKTPANTTAQPYSLVAGLIGALALGLSIVGLARAKSLHKGKGVAITAIVIGAFSLFGVVGENLLLPAIASARNSARQNVLENSIRQSGAKTLSLSPQDSIHYTSGATETDARNLGAAMQELHMLTGGGRHDVLLSKESGMFNISLLVPSSNLFNDEAKAALPRIAGALAGKVGVPVRLRVLDFQMKELGSVQSTQ